MYSIVESFLFDQVSYLHRPPHRFPTCKSLFSFNNRLYPLFDKKREKSGFILTHVEYKKKKKKTR